MEVTIRFYWRRGIILSRGYRSSSEFASPLLGDYSFDWAGDVVGTVPVASVPVVESDEPWVPVLALLHVECVYGG